MKKYKVVKEFKGIPKGTILEADNDGYYKYDVEESDGVYRHFKLKESHLENNSNFEEITKSKVKSVVVSESDLDDSDEKNWNIVINVKCTEKRLHELKQKIEKL